MDSKEIHRRAELKAESERTGRPLECRYPGQANAPWRPLSTDGLELIRDDYEIRVKPPECQFCASQQKINAELASTVDNLRNELKQALAERDGARLSAANNLKLYNKLYDRMDYQAQQHKIKQDELQHQLGDAKTEIRGLRQGIDDSEQTLNQYYKDSETQEATIGQLRESLEAAEKKASGYLEFRAAKDKQIDELRAVVDNHHSKTIEPADSSAEVIVGLHRRLATTRFQLQQLRNEVNCRLEHGAPGGLTLRYIQEYLDKVKAGMELPTDAVAQMDAASSRRTYADQLKDEIYRLRKDKLDLIAQLGVAQGALVSTRAEVTKGCERVLRLRHAVEHAIQLSRPIAKVGCSQQAARRITRLLEACLEAVG